MADETLIDGRYRLLERIGAGGEAEVFRARDRRGERDVAIRFSEDSQAKEKIPRGLDHPSWVRWLDAGRDAQRGPYVVFELLEGETLHEIVPREKWQPGEWLEFLRESSGAIEALHEAGYVHGDLNAQNFLRIRMPARRWKLLELPFLRSSGKSRPALFGGIHALSPEQLEGRAPDARSDWYALGCLYYYAAAGEYPHRGDNAQELAISVLRFPPAPLREKAPAYPADVIDWVMGLLARAPGQREVAMAAARRVLAIA